jgi:TolB-like protein
MPLPDLVQAAPGTPPGLVQLIRRMTEKDREQRIAHCEALLGELGTIEITAKLAAQAPPPTVSPGATPAPGSTPVLGHASMPAVAEGPVPAAVPIPVPAADGARRRLVAGLLGGVGALVVTLLILTLASRWQRRPTQGPGKKASPPAERRDPTTPGPTAPTPAPAALIPAAAPAPLGQHGPLRLAVMQFKNIGNDRDLDFLTEGIGDTVLTALGTMQGRIRLIERGQIEQALQEIDFGQTKYVDKTTAVTLGKLTGAELAVLGSYQRSEGLIRVSARLIRTDTGDVLDTLLVTRPAKALFDVQDEVAAELKRRLLGLIASGGK